LIGLIARNAREDRNLTASRLRFPNRNRNRVRSLLRMLALRMQVPLRSWQQVSTCLSRRRDIIRITQLGAMPPYLRHADAKVEHEPAAGTSGGARARPQQNGVRGVRVGADLLACQRRYVSGNVDRTDRSRNGGRSGNLRLLARQMRRAGKRCKGPTARQIGARRFVQRHRVPRRRRVARALLDTFQVRPKPARCRQRVASLALNPIGLVPLLLDGIFHEKVSGRRLPFLP
jgi:hypothetical protein